VEERPVDAARQRASEIRGQVAGMGEHLVEQLRALIEELRTVADPDAVEAQLESMSTDAAEQVAASSARATRAEQAQRRAESERAQADAAAAEAVELADQLGVDLERVRERLAEQEQAGAQLDAELADTRTAAAARDEQAREELAEVNRDLVATRASRDDAERDRDAAAARADTATAAQVEALERARSAETRAEVETARAQRAETETAQLREQLEAARADGEALREKVGELRGEVATVTAQRDAAKADVAGEKAHGDQRVDDLRATHTEQLVQLREDLTRARDEARDQRSRADRAEAQRGTTPEGT
jgi:chromosome segregation ATPase